MKDFIEAIDGYKLYFVGYSAILFGILNAIFNFIDQTHSVYFIYSGFGLIGLKSALLKISN